MPPRPAWFAGCPPSPLALSWFAASSSLSVSSLARSGSSVAERSGTGCHTKSSARSSSRSGTSPSPSSEEAEGVSDANSRFHPGE